MRIKEHITAMLQERKLNSAEIAASLIEYPNSMEGDSRKEEVYQVAIQYFIEKQKCSRTVREVYSYNNRGTLELAVLLDCYEAYEGEKKLEYARKIARNLIDTQEYFLMRVSDEIKGPAFKIAIQYLEEQRDA